jgi:hypothetical protein
MKLVSSLAVALCCILLPTRSAGSKQIILKQAYITYADSDLKASEPACLPKLQNHAQEALVSFRNGFIPLSAPDFSPLLPSPVCHFLGFWVSQQPHRSYFSFFFLRSVFEHQIAINAP